MHSGSIAKQSATKARRAVLAALIGIAVIAAGLVAERFVFQSEFRAAYKRLLQAHLAADQILLADERLTMSANMAAAAGEERWIKRYNDNLPLIDQGIAAASELASPAVVARFNEETRASNDHLVELERNSFAKVRSEDSVGARRILDGDDYAFHKKVLSDGTSRFIESVINSVGSDLTQVEQRALVIIGAALLISIAGGLVVWRIFNTSLTRSANAFLATEEQINHLALNDMLTGLANRVSMRHALHVAIERANLNGSKLALLMIDLDRFKPINDRHGHLIGDLVLKEVALRIAKVLREGELRARYGGDEFVALVEYEADDEIPRSIAMRIVEELSSPMTLAGTHIQIGASAGFAIYPANAVGEEDLIRKADMALYRAKLEGRGRVRVYDLSLDIDTRALLEEELRQGISSGEVVPYFQPLIDLSSGELRGFEVLSRWRHPARGLINPDQFIPLAEDTGQISALTLAVLKQACTAASLLPTDLTLAINISPQQLQDELLAVKIRGALYETGFAPQRLEVELTEQALVADFALAKEVINSLKAIGIRMALDDFGTGYSSLCYLSELPFDTLKIDRSFIKTLHVRSESAKIVTAIVSLGKSLGLTTVAEGVGTDSDVALLREIGCSAAQGFLYSKPVPESEIAELVHNFTAARHQRAIA